MKTSDEFDLTKQIGYRGPLRREKMSEELFSSLKKACIQVCANFNVDPLRVRTERDRWDILFLTEMPSLLYKANLNDAHIDTALRKIFA